jgi:hypothetical protein
VQIDAISARFDGAAKPDSGSTHDGFRLALLRKMVVPAAIAKLQM